MATNIPIPVLKVSFAQTLIIFLTVTVVFGALHLLAISKPNNRFFKAWLALGF
jgi:hypothetical protein